MAQRHGCVKNPVGKATGQRKEFTKKQSSYSLRNPIGWMFRQPVVQCFAFIEFAAW